VRKVNGYGSIACMEIKAALVLLKLFANGNERWTPLTPHIRENPPLTE